MRNAIVAAGAALALALPVPASAMSAAESVRRLDIMLMVTGLRCRASGHDFSRDYARFTSAHLSELNAANARLRFELSRRHGAAGAQRAFDRLSTTMANEYGQGHPWLTCRDLRMAARNLAAADGIEPLEEAAGQLLAERGSPRFARIGR